ncbi:polyamine ABC transporter substrate-binding protein, partial [Francisella tularensis subsp. holarctica]|nr:polyamine ABC transporter substrate-binding protein [Francisella tularensis subsp. holarctica]
MKRKVFIIGMLVSLFNLAYSNDESYICDNKILKSPITATHTRTQLNFTNWADYISPYIVP